MPFNNSQSQADLQRFEGEAQDLMKKARRYIERRSQERSVIAERMQRDSAQKGQIFLLEKLKALRAGGAIGGSADGQPYHCEAKVAAPVQRSRGGSFAIEPIQRPLMQPKSDGPRQSSCGGAVPPGENIAHSPKKFSPTDHHHIPPPAADGKDDHHHLPATLEPSLLD